MYTVLGATGRVGAEVARLLLRSGHQVRAVVREPARADTLRADGAEVVRADLADREAVATALRGSAGAFVMLPFDITVADPEQHAVRLGATVADAVALSDVDAVALLSSVGADLPEGTGPILALHHLEERLRATNTTVSAIRASFFQDDVRDVVEVARTQGVYPVFGPADVGVPMNAACDIARVAADALTRPTTTHEAITLDPPVYTHREVAAMLGDALRTDLAVVELPREAWHDTLVETGVPPQAARSLEALYDAAARGILVPRGDRSVAVTTPMTETIRSLVRTTVASPAT